MSAEHRELMQYLDRIDAKLNRLKWELAWGDFFSPDGRYVTLDPVTLMPKGDVEKIPPKPEWPDDK